MEIEVCRKKISHLTVTHTDLEYVEGSLTLGENILEASGLRPYEKVLVINLNSGDRFETYLIAGETDPGMVCLNGGTARLGKTGDRLIVLSFGRIPESELDAVSPDIFKALEGNRLERKQ